jgi:hypothetical protein
MRKRQHCRGTISPRFFPFSGAIYSDANGEAKEICSGVRADTSSSSSGDDVIDLLVLRKMISGRNPSCARVADSGIEGCVVGGGVR